MIKHGNNPSSFKIYRRTVLYEFVRNDPPFVRTSSRRSSRDNRSHRDHRTALPAGLSTTLSEGHSGYTCITYFKPIFPFPHPQLPFRRCGRLTCDCTVGTRNIPNDTRCSGPSWPSRTPVCPWNTPRTCPYCQTSCKTCQSVIASYGVRSVRDWKYLK